MLRHLVPMAIALMLCVAAIAQPMQSSAPANVPITQWRTGLVELDEGWKANDGDDLRWARTGFDDSSWKTVNIEDIGVATVGWRWFRLHVNVGPDQPTPLLLIDGGDGVYELYINGERVPGPQIRSQFALTRPKERIFKLNNDQGDFQIALRTFAPAGYVAYGFQLVDGISLGGQTATQYENHALERERLYVAIPAVAINLLLVLAGLGILALYLSQSAQREYFFLSIFLILLGISNGVWHLEQAGVLSIAENFLFADPLFYAVAIVQIEFTFSFVGRRVGRPWRVYEVVLLLALPAVAAVWLGHLSETTYNIIEAIVTAPPAFLLPALLFVWYRRGNREAGWLIIPSLLTGSAGVIYDLGLSFFFLGWKRLEFLIEPIPIGPIPLQISDAANLLFLLAIGVVMFFRFTHVSREQARSAAELDAAREIQRRLVPAVLPAVAGYQIETAYLPAQEVGGDFYQVLDQADGATLVVVGDVSGKGLKAAMTGTLAIGALRALAAEGLGPSALLRRLNQEMLHTQDGGFITCLCARVARDGGVVMANAGHLSPYRNGEEIELDSGLPLGITATAEYSVVALQLKPGETLTLLSDGVLEARNESGELFGFERTREISGQSAESIARSAQQFGQEDDITVLTLKFCQASAVDV